MLNSNRNKSTISFFCVIVSPGLVISISYQNVKYFNGRRGWLLALLKHLDNDPIIPKNNIRFPNQIISEKTEVYVANTRFGKTYEELHTNFSLTSYVFLINLNTTQISLSN